MEQNIAATPTVSAAVAPSAPAPQESSNSWSAGLIVCAGLIAILAFFLGSFRAVNTDIWLNLGAGKLLAAGQYHFGVDPFSWASQGAFWANPSWLSSWIAYLLYQGVGPSSLVVVKALLIVLMTGFVFATRTKDSPLLPGIEITALTLIAASPRFTLQSVTLSYLGLAILTWLLTRGGFFGALASDEPAKTNVRWQIPLLFLVWSNFDGYFVLGLMVLATAALGLALFAATRPAAKQLGIVLGYSTLACILNPHMVANLTLPAELAYLGRGWLPSAWTAAGETALAINAGDPGFYPIVSPFSSFALSNPNFSFNLAGLSFYLLMLINIASFVIAGLAPNVRGFAARGFVCLTIGLLAALQIRLVPFYALVAGPLSVLNFTDYARAFPRRAAISRNGRQFATWTTCAFLVMSTFLAWPGWLHLGLPNFQGETMFQSGRRVEWVLEPDASLHGAALTLKDAAPPRNVYNFIPDLAHYCAFFAPDVKCGIDARFALFASTAHDYATLRNDLWDDANEYIDPKARDKRRPDARIWPKMLADWKITDVAISNYHRAGGSKLGQLAYFLFQHDATWKPIVADGQSLVFAYSPDAVWPADFLLAKWNREAFGPLPEADWLPADAPLVPPRELDWLEQFIRGRGPVPLDTNRAMFEIGSYQKFAILWQDPFFAAFQTLHILPAVGLSSGGASPILALHAAHMTTLSEYVLRRRPVGSDPNFFHSLDFGPPALPILAQRNLRRSLDANPNIAVTHALVSQNVKRIMHLEEWWTRHQNPSLRQQLRQVQTATALRNALTLAPDNYDYQFQYAEMMFKNNYLDLAMAHFGDAIKALEEVRALDPEQKKAIKNQRDQWEKRYKVLNADLKRRRDDFDLKTTNATPMERFRTAVVLPWRFTDLENRTVDDPRGRGLVLIGLKALEKMNAADLKDDRERTERAYFLIRLNCFQGRVNEAAQIYGKYKEDLGKLGIECVAWIAAGTGWYKNLDDALATFEHDLQQNAAQQMPQIAQYIGLGLALNQLSDQPTLARIAHGNLVERFILLRSDNIFQSTAALCEVRTLRGIFILEQGDVGRALKLFEEALDGDNPFLDRPIAQRYRDLLRAQVK